MMGLEFDQHKPIYQQLIERICHEIIREDLKPGEKLASVRAYALEVGVNVNTVQRVYQELERKNIVETRRGQGTFVTSDHERLTHLREDMKNKFIKQFIRNIQEMGFSVEDIIQAIQIEGRDGE